MDVQELRTQIEVAVSRNDVDLLVALFQASLSLGKQGKELRTAIEEYTREMAHALGYSNVNNFQGLVRAHDWHILKEMYATDFVSLVEFLETNKPYWSNLFVERFDANIVQHKTAFLIKDCGRLAYVLCLQAKPARKLLEVVAYLLKNNYDEELAEGFHGDDRETFMALTGTRPDQCCKTTLSERVPKNSVSEKTLPILFLLNATQKDFVEDYYYTFGATIEASDAATVLSIFASLLVEILRGQWSILFEQGKAKIIIERLVLALLDFLSETDRFTAVPEKVSTKPDSEHKSLFDIFVLTLDKYANFEEMLYIINYYSDFFVTDAETIQSLSKEMRYLFLRKDLEYYFASNPEFWVTYSMARTTSMQKRKWIKNVERGIRTGDFLDSHGILFNDTEYIKLFGQDKIYQRLRS